VPGPVAAQESCGRCGRPDAALRPLAGALRWPAVFAMAFLHAGLWAGDLLSARLCRSCRAKAAALSLAVTLGALAAVLGGALTLLGIARA
jgi:hypothetical protein